MRGKPGTKSTDLKRLEGRKLNFGEAFGLTDEKEDFIPSVSDPAYNKLSSYNPPALPRLRSGSGPSNRQLDAYDGANERLTGPRMASVDLERSPEGLSPHSAGYGYGYPYPPNRGYENSASRGGSDESTAEQIGMQPMGTSQGYGRGSSATRF